MWRPKSKRPCGRKRGAWTNSAAGVCPPSDKAARGLNDAMAMRVPDVGTPKSKLPPMREGRRRSKQRKNLRSRGKMTGGLRVAPLVSGSPPYRHQPVSAHLEFRRAPLDRSGLIGRLDRAKSDGFGSDLVDAPGRQLWRRFGLACHTRSIATGSEVRSIRPTEPRPLPKLNPPFCH
jgi:hypothetical protein